MTIKEAINKGKEELKSPEPLLDAQLLLMHSARERGLKIDKIKLYTEPDLELSAEIIAAYSGYIKRRAASEPVQYIVGHCEFMGMDMSVNAHTLIPRPDTEILVENAIEYIQKKRAKTVLDLCTGSGAVAVAVAAFCPDTAVCASDISPDALAVARLNAEKNGTSDRIEFFEGDLFEPLSGKKFDIILSNPPYIRHGDIASLDANVRNYEPITALDGGADGLVFYRKITEQAKNHLNTGGKIYFEIGFDQSDDVHAILGENGFSDIATIKDLAGLDRVVCGKI